MWDFLMRAYIIGSYFRVILGAGRGFYQLVNRPSTKRAETFDGKTSDLGLNLRRFLILLTYIIHRSEEYPHVVENVMDNRICVPRLRYYRLRKTNAC